MEMEFRDNLGRLLLRDLQAVRQEIERYPDDQGPWKSIPGLTNCGGTLVLHLAGNLQHFLGAVLGQNGYVRNRDVEFVKRNVSRADLIREINVTSATVTNTLKALSASQLGGFFPQDLNNLRIPTGIWLMHLATHLTYHLGQIDYHRRCVAGDPTPVGTLSLPALLLPFPPEPVTA
ncbi:MAG: DinB family protein [Gemmatimonadaceae bacterium]